MKKYLFLFAIIALMWQPAKAGGTDTNVVWSIQNQYITDLSEIINSPDGKYIYVNGYHDEDDLHFLKIDVNNGNIIDTIYGKNLIAGFSSNGQFLYTWGRYYGYLKKLDINTYKTVDSIKNYQDLDGWVSSVSLIPGGKLLISIQQGKYFYAIIDANTFEIIYKQPIIYPCYGALHSTVSNSGNYFVLDQSYREWIDSASGNFKVYSKTYLWDLINLKPIKLLYDNGGTSLYDMKFSQDGNYFGLNWSGYVLIFNTIDYSLNNQLQSPRSIDFSYDSKVIALGVDKSAEFYNLAQKNAICSENIPTEKKPTVIKFSDSNKCIIVFDALNSILTKIKSCTESTGVIDNKQSDTIIYPNPLNDKLTFTNSKLLNVLTEIKIFDKTGRLVKESQIQIINNSVTINVSDFPIGSYILVINNFSYQFIVAR